MDKNNNNNKRPINNAAHKRLNFKDKADWKWGEKTAGNSWAGCIWMAGQILVAGPDLPGAHFSTRGWLRSRQDYFWMSLDGVWLRVGDRFLPPQHASWPMLGWFRGLEFTSKFHHRSASASPRRLSNFHHHPQSASHFVHAWRKFPLPPTPAPHCHHNKRTSINETET